MSDEDLTQSTPGSPVQPRLLAERYDVIEIVGAGASAVTWRGHDRRLDRQVAIKILRRDIDQDDAYVQRFEREARTSASVSHGNVVNVYDVGQQDGWLYLVMQLVDGEDLKHTIGRRGPLPPEEIYDITRQILHGLGAIHRAGILHRDIKPQNVLIDREGVVRVTDFGIAQTTVDIGLTSAGVTVGTAAYMAPEQARASTLSDATDLYAVGVVMYEMLTGVLPFDRPSAAATMLAHIQDQPIAPSRRAPHLSIPPLLDGIVLQAMSKDPGARFRGAAAMARALEGDMQDSGGTTRFVAAQERTRVAPTARARNQAWPPATPLTTVPPPHVQLTPATGGYEGRSLLTAVFVLILLAIAVVAGYMYYEYTRDDDVPGTPGGNEQLAPVDDPQPTTKPTSPSEPTSTSEPTLASEPTPTAAQVIVAPTTDLQPEPTTTPTAEPIDEPTNVPIERVIPIDQVIEPEVTPVGD